MQLKTAGGEKKCICDDKLSPKPRLKFLLIRKFIGIPTVLDRRVARNSQWGGGLFWKLETTANDLDPDFH